MPKHAAQRRPRHEPIIPDKLYFRIGEVARLCGVETYVLRFWETEFPQMRPNKSGTGQRLYRKRDVELAMRVRRLLHDEGYTIAGARQVLAQEARELRSKSPQLPLIEGGASNTRVQSQTPEGPHRTPRPPRHSLRPARPQTPHRRPRRTQALRLAGKKCHPERA